MEDDITVSIAIVLALAVLFASIQARQYGILSAMEV